MNWANQKLFGIPTAKVKVVARWVGAAVCLMLNWYILTYWRTQTFGFSTSFTVHEVILFSPVWLPIGCIPFLALGMRRILLGTASLIAISVLLSETYSGLQERAIVLKFGSIPDREILARRWKPFSNHDIEFRKPENTWIGLD